MGRILAFLHIIIGFIVACFGIVQFLAGGNPEVAWIGLFNGIWMCIGGGLGIPGTRKEQSTYRDTFTCLFMCFSITSAVFCGTNVFCYFYIGHGYVSVAIPIVILILYIANVVIGIWVAICCCFMNPCTHVAVTTVKKKIEL